MAQAAVFDIGGVLVPEGTRMQQLQQHLEELTGTFDRDAFERAYWGGRDGYDLGASNEGFWVPVLEKTGVAANPSLVDSLARRDADLNSTIADEPRALLEDLNSAGVTLAILSNAPLPMAEAVRSRDWFSLFQKAVFSSEHAVMKPAAEIFVLVDEALGVASRRGDVHFFDDRPLNIDGARSHGWKSHLWTGVDAARSELRASGLELNDRKVNIDGQNQI